MSPIAGLLLALLTILGGLFGLLVWQIRLHQRHTVMYEMLFEARREELERQAQGLRDIETRMQALEGSARPRLAPPNGQAA